MANPNIPREQYDDLTPSERDEFNSWMQDQDTQHIRILAARMKSSSYGEPGRMPDPESVVKILEREVNTQDVTAAAIYAWRIAIRDESKNLLSEAA